MLNFAACNNDVLHSCTSFHQMFITITELLGCINIYAEKIHVHRCHC